MTKAADGLWTYTSAPLAPEIYSYVLKVDDVTILDPDSHHFVPNYLSQDSMFIVGGTPAEPWEETDVPHGEIHRHFYSSKIVGDRRDYYVYTPPNFDREKKYPVLYLLHGFSDTSDAWIVVGRANFILDNLIAQGKAKPMIVVMPLGYGEPKVLNYGWGDMPAELRQRNRDKFVDTLLEEVIPQVESEYPVERSADGRAIAGLSMGGAETLYAGLGHMNEFGWIASMSAGLHGEPSTQVPRFDAQQTRNLKLLWIACGKDDHLIKANRAFKDWLTSQNVKFTSVETEGDHDWPVWRHNLIDLVQLLFR